MRVVTWNMDGATHRKNTKLSAAKWWTLLELSPDIAMLQEVNNVPECVCDAYGVAYEKGSFFGGGKATYGTALIAKRGKWTIGGEAKMESKHDWVNAIQREFPGWLVGREIVNSASGPCLNVVSVHSPAFPIWPIEDGCDRLNNIMASVDIAPIKLDNFNQIWFTQILCSLLKGKGTGVADDADWIVAGDFNSSVLLKPKKMGAAEIINLMNDLGLRDCIFESFGEHVPTFRAKAKNAGPAIHQLDYVYAGKAVFKRLTKVLVVRGARANGQKISDHFPVVCDFDDLPRSVMDEHQSRKGIAHK